MAAGRRGQMPQRREPKGIHKQRPDAVIHKHLRQQQHRRRLDKRRPRPCILAQIRPSRAAEESRGQHQLERHGFRGSVAPSLCVYVCLSVGTPVVRWKLVPRHLKGKWVSSLYAPRLYRNQPRVATANAGKTQEKEANKEFDGNNNQRDTREMRSRMGLKFKPQSSRSDYRIQPHPPIIP